MMIICGCWLDTRHAFRNQLVWAKNVLNQLSRKHIKHSIHPWNLKSHSFYKSVELQKNKTKSSPPMWKLSVCLSGLLARVGIFACVTFLMNCHVTRQVTWFPRNLQRAFDPTGALCPTLPYQQVAFALLTSDANQARRPWGGGYWSSVR